MNREIRKLRQSFSYALHGLKMCMMTERNFRIHLTAACYVSLFAFLGRLDSVRYSILCLCFAVMMAGELMNTAIERLCDKQTTGYDQTVKQAKDIAAAAVFVCATFCVIIGIVFFVPSGALFRAFHTLYTHLWVLGLTILSIPIAIGFIFGLKK